MNESNQQIPSFNLWTEPWITLEQMNGSLVQRGIYETLLNAHTYIAIYDQSPLVVVGIHRLLVAILQDTLQIQARADLEDLWEMQKFPAADIERFGAQFANRFDLFSEHEPFMQSADISLYSGKEDEGGSVARLFVETPSGTETIHYHHMLAEEHVFSPATVAAALVTIPAFVTIGGPGLMASINGTPPIYILPGGRTLFESLAASLITPTQQYWPHLDAPNRAWWRREATVEKSSKFTETKAGEKGLTRAMSKQLSQVSYLHGLTFPARRIRLYPTRVNTNCTRSGQFTEWGVRRMVFEMGESKFDDVEWIDPFVAYRLPKSESRSSPLPICPSTTGKAIWREFTSLFLQEEQGSTLRPRILNQFTTLDVGNSQSIIPVRCISFNTENMKYLEWSDFGFDVPLNVLREIDAATIIKNALKFSEECAEVISKKFRIFFCKTKGKSERNSRLKERMVEEYWSTLGVTFRKFIIYLGDSTTRRTEFLNWLENVVDVAEDVFRRATEAVGGDGITLRKRVESQNECFHELIKKHNRAQKTKKE